MKTLIIFSFLLVGAVQAQQYSIDWHKIAGGGGTSTGAVYQVSGAIGQPDAGVAMSGGNYSVTGGFWSLISLVQTIGAPTLAITPSNNTVTISWPTSPSGFVLQQKSNLVTTNWTTSGYPITTNGAVESITVTSSSGNLFFRLSHP